jgi:hypothetical protein
LNLISPFFGRFSRFSGENASFSGENRTFSGKNSAFSGENRTFSGDFREEMPFLCIEDVQSVDFDRFWAHFRIEKGPQGVKIDGKLASLTEIGRL